MAIVEVTFSGLAGEHIESTMPAARALPPARRALPRCARSCARSCSRRVATAMRAARAACTRASGWGPCLCPRHLAPTLVPARSTATPAEPCAQPHPLHAGTTERLDRWLERWALRAAWPTSRDGPAPREIFGALCALFLGEWVRPRVSSGCNDGRRPESRFRGVLPRRARAVSMSPAHPHRRNPGQPLGQPRSEPRSAKAAARVAAAGRATPTGSVELAESRFVNRGVQHHRTPGLRTGWGTNPLSAGIA